MLAKKTISNDYVEPASSSEIFLKPTTKNKPTIHMKHSDTYIGMGRIRALAVLLALITFAWFLMIPIAQAQPGDPVESSLVAFKVITNAENKEVLEPADQVSPGDIIEYHLVYTNTLDKGITNLKPELPVPAGMTYIDKTASPILIGASLQENEVVSKLPIYKKTTLPNGNVVNAEVSAENFKRLQWLVTELGAGQSTTIKVRMRVNSTSTTR